VAKFHGRYSTSTACGLRSHTSALYKAKSSRRTHFATRAAPVPPATISLADQGTLPAGAGVMTANFAALKMDWAFTNAPNIATRSSA
jgi:hypothetical protein